MHAGYLIHKLTGSQINTLQMKQDRLNKKKELFEHIFDEYYSDDEIFIQANNVLTDLVMDLFNTEKKYTNGI